MKLNLTLFTSLKVHYRTLDHKIMVFYGKINWYVPLWLMYFQDGGATWRPTLEPLTRMYFQWHIILSREYFITWTK